MIVHFDSFLLKKFSFKLAEILLKYLAGTQKLVLAWKLDHQHTTVNQLSHEIFTGVGGGGGGGLA